MLKTIDFLFLDYVSEIPAKVSQLTHQEAGIIFNKPSHFLSKNQALCKIEELKDIGLLNICSSYVRLTERGGREWESIFNPDWSKYLSVESFYRFDREFVVFRSFCLENFEYVLSACSDFVVFNKIKKIELWKPYYWKSGGFAYEIICLVKDYDAFFQILMNVQEPWRKVWVGDSYQAGIS